MKNKVAYFFNIIKRDWAISLAVIYYSFIILVTDFLDFPNVEKTTSVLDDPVYHYPTIIGFRDQFPNLDLYDYGSSTPPLFHILLMFFGFTFSFENNILRIGNVLISISCLLFLRYIIRDHDDKNIIIMLFFLQPYYFVQSHYLMTNVLFVFFGLYCYYQIGKEFSMSNSLKFCLSYTTAFLTRQFALFLIVPFFIKNYHSLNYRNIYMYVPLLIPVVVILSFFIYWDFTLTNHRFAGEHSVLFKIENIIILPSIIVLYLLPFFVFQFIQSRVKFESLGISLFILILVFLLDDYALNHPIVGLFHGSLYRLSISASFESFLPLLWSIIYLVCIAMFCSFIYNSVQKSEFTIVALVLSFILMTTFSRGSESYCAFIISMLIYPLFIKKENKPVILYQLLFTFILSTIYFSSKLLQHYGMLDLPIVDNQWS